MHRDSTELSMPRVEQLFFVVAIHSLLDMLLCLLEQ
jgi:hypothetical protein